MRQRSLEAKNAGTAPTTRKRQKTNAGAPAITPGPAATICGVGPVSVPSSGSNTMVPVNEHPIASTSTIATLNSSKSILISCAKLPLCDTKAAVSDMWYFMWAVDSPEKPEKMPENQPRLMYKPNLLYVACRLCG